MAHIRVSGNVPGGPRALTASEAVQAGKITADAMSSGATPWEAASAVRAKYGTTSLSYPLNVEGDSQLGHYIMFFINKIDPSALQAASAARGKAERIIAETDQQIIARGGSSSDDEEALAEYRAAQATLASGGGTGAGESNSILLRNAPVKRLTGAISLYMPPNVTVNYESKWADQDVGILAQTGFDAIKGFMAGKAVGDQFADFFENAAHSARKSIWGAIDTITPGAKTLYAIERGRIITPKMEVMFEGIGRRNFSYTFTFIPKSKKEADAIHNIVWNFKYHMAANYVGGGQHGHREMDIPNIFDIQYMHIGYENRNLNKIGTCALTKMDVEYGGDRYVSHEGGVPQTTKLTLNFTELEIITKDHIDQGY